MKYQIERRASERWIKAACLIAAIGMGTVFADSPHAIDISGTVRAKSGEPLRGVYVLASRGVTKTDEKGHYSLKDPGSVILFSLYNYTPLAKVLESGMTALDVVLEESAATEWVAPSCPKGSSREQRMGSEVQFVKPKIGVIQRVTDADYTRYIIGYGPKQARQWLNVWFGPTVSNGSPPDLLLAQSVEHRERAFKCGSHSGGQGTDISGRLSDGKHWRWVRYPDTLASYQNATEDSARFFDRIIDGFCCTTE